MAAKKKRKPEGLHARKGEASIGRRKVPDVPHVEPRVEIAGPSPERSEFVARLMLAGLPLGQIVEQAARSLGLDRRACREVYDKLCDAWTADVEQDLRHARSQAVNRIRRDLAQMRSPSPLRSPHSGEVLTEVVLDGFGQKMKRPDGTEVRRPIAGEVDWKHVNAHERLLASIEGTLRPVEVSVDLVVTQRRSLATLVSTLSEGELQELEDEQRLLEEHAAPR